MTKKKRISLRLLSVVIAVLLFTGASWVGPNIDVAANIVYVAPFDFNHPDDCEAG